MTHPSHKQIRLQGLIFITLFLAVIATIAFLSTRYHFQSDWTENNRNTLSEASGKLLAQMEQPITILAFARDSKEIRTPIIELIKKYQYNKDNITLTFINPDTQPGAVRDNNISIDGEIVIEYQSRKENLKTPSEQSLTNALYRLARSNEKTITSLEGHGERKLNGKANFELGELGNQLKQKGFKIQGISLANTPSLPDNTSVLVIADPQTALLPGEVKIIKEFLHQGGNLLWMMDPGPSQGLDPISELLSLQREQGIIVDPSTQMLGIDDPRFALVAEYPQHAITQNLSSLTLFPQAGGLSFIDNSDWNISPLLYSMPRSWLEKDEIIDEVSFDEQRDIAGPIIFGAALERENEQSNAMQRIVVVADGDFLSNTYQGNGSNLDLGLNIINWLSHDDHFIDIPVKAAQDRSLELSKSDEAIIGFGLLLIIPGGLLIAGLLIWLKRRKR